ncbi:BZ3500_MvSof-1268-A1-R1_Chr3-2g06332 [Microbotryum saponariae]|uniref:Phosphatidate cytidylyltransferase, mitochondrial n=1 Tax=Microbotryum saponariae TaxID=289078 RepID=A0A2X0LXY1_9BASI|nr:BZ3500_MvSof-1268-A1-R1_Chr3-2g06332 [Microbotryum saponariae]SDA04303.1 BZ3501_MvSof-1269-A2-R1_Chr3-2g06023 [Microbotryum saponariae]
MLRLSTRIVPVSRPSSTIARMTATHRLLPMFTLAPLQQTLVRTALLHSSAQSRLDTERSTTSTSSSSSYPPPTSSSRRWNASSTTTEPPIPTPPKPPTPPPVDARLTRRRITSVTELPKSFGRNQIIAVSDEVKMELEEILADFKAPVRFAFAYGSGVFRQKGYAASEQPMLDFVFAVSHPSHWHAINMAQNPHHYSMPMRLLGSDAVAWMQDKGLGANVWFNVDVQIKGKVRPMGCCDTVFGNETLIEIRGSVLQTLKYGVISIDALCRDMLDWETLYVSGRTQKPVSRENKSSRGKLVERRSDAASIPHLQVRILKDDARVRLANQVNLASALRTALLRLPEDFTEVELFEEIAGLSYRGDFRMKVGENPLKVRNIVAAQLDAFRSLYGGLLKSFWKSVHVIGERPGELGEVRLMRQDRSAEQRATTASKLPIGLKGKVMAHYERKWNLKKALVASKGGAGEGEKAGTVGKALSEEELRGQKEGSEKALWERIVQDDEFDVMLDKSLAQIVGRPTFNQSLKGILSAGPVKSLRYIGPKLKKKWSKSTSSSLPAPVEQATKP